MDKIKAFLLAILLFGVNLGSSTVLLTIFFSWLQGSEFVWNVMEADIRIQSYVAITTFLTIAMLLIKSYYEEFVKTFSK